MERKIECVDYGVVIRLVWTRGVTATYDDTATK